MVIDLQIKRDDQDYAEERSKVANNKFQKNETLSESGKRKQGQMVAVESPLINTVENSQIGDGLNHLNAENDDDSQVVFEE